MADQQTESAVRAVIDEYAAACRAGSTARLKVIFAENALMSGYLGSQYLCGSTAPFLAYLENGTPPAKAGTPYTYEIPYLDCAVDVASVVMKEKGFMGMDFTNYFHLACVEGRWLIVSKTFHVDAVHS
ncbi:nuclear transport factor 2 family protein [Kordiimonas pumila]|uniref:Nuclear transport factor 2 family protein n=1 Tax=Kordiimonas pumila TaxID=2161677 RepID=A0ABV7D130_9PROT|nr:nuclear transport factor 2 family protein [Kordiimonas pumila]